MRWVLASSLLWATASVLGEGERELLYLMKYGYMEGRGASSALVTEEGLRIQLRKAITDFQAFAGLNQTGEMDAETRELMDTPRCGVRDIIGHGAVARRRKRYVLQGSRWNVKTLTYRVTKYPSTSRLKKSEVDQQIKTALTMWEDVTDLQFQHKASGSVHIAIRFERYEHGDGDPFDGPGGTLAHAYFPQFGGDVHVDDTEYWTIDSFTGTNLLQTMVHELGHSLGLSHSDMRSAIMAPFYKGWSPSMKLDQDDIKAIQALYGEKAHKPTPKPKPTPSPTNPGVDFPVEGGGSGGQGLCTNSNIDAIIRSKAGHTYVFQGEQYWRLTDTSVAPGYPKRISTDWPGLPNNIDTGFTWQDTGYTYFFKGSQYWKFVDMTAKPGYPKPISEGFPGIPAAVDTAFVWGGNNKIYFFKGNKYWKFDPQRQPHVRSDRYPKAINDWDLPNNMEGALQWDNGRTYFFKAGNYWRFNDRRFTIDSASPPFPRSTAEWWFGCPRVNQLQEGEGGESVILSQGSSVSVVLRQGGDQDDYLVGNEVLDVTDYDE